MQNPELNLSEEKNDPQDQKALEKKKLKPFRSPSMGNQPSMPLKVQPTTKIPEELFCAICKKPVISRVQFEVGSGTWGCFATLLFVMPILAWAPFCYHRFQNALHFCPNCEVLIGTKKYKTCECE